MIRQPCLLKDDLAVLQHHEIGNAHHTESLRKHWPLFCIDLEHNCAARHFCCDPLDLWRSHAARSAPCRPEIDKYGNASAAYNLIEQVRVGINGFRHRS